MKPYSESTHEIIDEEVKKIVDECYERTEKLILEKKELIGNLAEELLSLETLNLRDIVRVLGDRPFGMKDNLKEDL